MSRKSYLNDFKMNAEGKYIYTGAVYTLQNHKQAGLKLGLMTVAAFLSVTGSGFINAAGLNNTFYVIIPYILEIVCLFALCWNTVRLLWARGEFREYVFSPVKNRIPSSALTLAVFAGLGFICSVLFMIFHGFEAKPVQCVIYLILKAADLTLAILIYKYFPTLVWEQKN